MPLQYQWDNLEIMVRNCITHYNDVIMAAIASQITSLTIVYSTVYSGADQRKHQSSASLAFVRGIHRGQVISPHKWPVTRKTFPFDDVIIYGKQRPSKRVSHRSHRFNCLQTTGMNWILTSTNSPLTNIGYCYCHNRRSYNVWMAKRCCEASM